MADAAEPAGLDALFDPMAGEWTRVSPALATLRRLTGALPLAVVAIACGVTAALLPAWQWLPALGAVILAGCAVWAWRWAETNRRSWGYAENAEDLLITSGVWFRRLVAVPYGRMQFVDVQAGPLHRLFGVATVTLHTASTETAATIPGVPADEAHRLRNRLTELGETRGAGV